VVVLPEPPFSLPTTIICGLRVAVSVNASACSLMKNTFNFSGYQYKPDSGF